MHSMPENSPLTIAQQVVLVRGQKVLIDSDLAALYNVSTKRLRASKVLATSNTELTLRLEALAQKTDLIVLNQKTFEHDAGLQIKQLIDALRELMSPPPSPKKRPIGFIAAEEDQ